MRISDVAIRGTALLYLPARINTRTVRLACWSATCVRRVLRPLVQLASKTSAGFERWRGIWPLARGEV